MPLPLQQIGAIDASRDGADEHLSGALAGAQAESQYGGPRVRRGWRYRRMDSRKCDVGRTRAVMGVPLAFALLGG